MLRQLPIRATAAEEALSKSACLCMSLLEPAKRAFCWLHVAIHTRGQNNLLGIKDGGGVAFEGLETQRCGALTHIKPHGEEAARAELEQSVAVDDEGKALAESPFIGMLSQEVRDRWLWCSKERASNHPMV